MPSICSSQHKATWVALVGSIISGKIKCLHFLQDVSVTHIPHLYSKEMSAKSDVVC